MNAPLTKQQWEDMRRQSETAILTKIAPVKALLGYQAKAFGLLNSAGVSVLVIEKSRRIGFTWGLASYAALKASKARAAGGDDVLYISYSQDMTREFIDAVAMWAGAYSLAAAEVDEFVFEDKLPGEDTKSIQAFRIRMASGFEVTALSSAPRSLRGKQGVVIIDEAAFVDQLEELLKAALALLIWGGQVIICSTHDGVDNPFNVLVQDVLGGRKPFAHMKVDFDDALKDGLYKRICFVQGKTWSAKAEAEFRDQIIGQYGDGADEELFCVAAQGSGSWLSAALIEARMTEPAETILRLDLPPDFLQRDDLARKALVSPFMDKLEAFLDTLPRDVLYALGFDFARVADLSDLKLLSIEPNLKRRCRLALELRRVPYAEQKDITRLVIKTLLSAMVGAAFDATGAGAEVAETMGREFGFAEADGTGGLVHEIKLSQEWYRINMPPVKSALEDDLLSLPADTEILADFRLVKVIRGIPLIPDLRTGEKGKKRHGDAAVSTALAYFASRMQYSEFGYRAVTGGSTDAPANDTWETAPDDSVGMVKDAFRPPLGTRIKGGLY